jgi:two-component system, LuxR family, response regulator FixJ
MSTEPTIYIVDDDEAVRKSLSLLMKVSHFKFAAFASAQAFLDDFVDGAPGCLVVDVRMPVLSGLELQHELTARCISIPVLVVTGHGDIAMAVQAMKAGAADFIEKPFKNDFLLERIRQSLALSTDQRWEKERHAKMRARLQSLTDRERQVMDLLVMGKLNKVVAADLGISVRTVETHRSKIMEKLQTKSLSDMVRIALLVSKS